MRWLIESGRPLKRNATTGLPRVGDRFDQLVLPADEVEAGAVAHVLQVPGFARSLLVAADGQDDDVGLLRDFDGLGDLPAVFFGIARDNLSPDSRCRRW